MYKRGCVYVSKGYVRVSVPLIIAAKPPYSAYDAYLLFDMNANATTMEPALWCGVQSYPLKLETKAMNSRADP